MEETKNVQRAKSESLKVKFDDMRMEEGETVAQYVARIKEFVSAIKGATGQIDDDTMLSKVLRKLLPCYQSVVNPRAKMYIRE